MFSVLSCIAVDHDPVFLLFAIAILLIGSVVTMRLFARVRRTENFIKNLWLFLAGLIGGGTIWSTHFISMLAYKSPVILGFDLTLTVVSLVIAMGSTSLAFVLASRTQKSLLIEAGGLVLGLGIAAMHYTGMSAIQVSGSFVWDWFFVGSSLVVGCLFSTIAISRIARPVTRFCKYGASAGFCLAVGSMHFTGMTALTIVPANVDLVRTAMISGPLLGTIILVVMALLLSSAFITYSIDLKNAEENSRHYQHLALHDPLTGVLNRYGCESRLKQLMETNADDTAGIAVVAIDLDRFKEINDVHGHAAGDHLLRTLAQRLCDAFDGTEMLGRFGGDEFLAMKSGIYSRSSAAAFGEKIRDLIQQSVEWKNTTLATSASIGIAAFPHDGTTASSLMEMADLAMYRAKTEGRNRVVSYDRKMDEANREKSTIAFELSQAAQKGELELYFQLQNNTSTREISGVEALVRWHHPIRGTVSPGVFIPIAEETGLISELGDWILKEACTQAAGWNVPIKVAVNVASAQLADSNFSNRVEEVLLETGLPACRLELEITESGIIADVNHALRIIRQLKNLGVKIAMDDFGTGYSSLATLQSFPFDKIKIDREFVKEVHQRKQSAAIVRATIILGESLDIPVLAEGVESEEHMTFLLAEGCKEVQGFLFGKPMPGKDLVQLLDLAKDPLLMGELAIAS